MPNILKNNQPSINTFKIKESGASYILYDPELIAEPNVQLFDVDYHTKHDYQQNNSALYQGAKTGSSIKGGIGRARVIYFSYNNIPLVLKHYYRGGAVAAFIKDCYLGFNIENSRAFKEWRLLKKMRDLELPVPDAAAAHVKKSLFYYQADLITREIENSRTLADHLNEDDLHLEQWKKIGSCIKLFHQHDIYHADLNARNILLDDKDKIYLIDFDNSYSRVDSAKWKRENLARLKRSLLKFKNNESEFHFDEKNWSSLIEGYQ